MAAGAAEDSVARDDGAAHHPANAGVSQDCSRCLHVVAGWKITIADRDSEIPQAAGAAPTATPTAAETRAGAQAGGGCAPARRCCCSTHGQEKKGEGRGGSRAVGNSAAARGQNRGCQGSPFAEG